MKTHADQKDLNIKISVELMNNGRTSETIGAREWYHNELLLRVGLDIAGGEVMEELKQQIRKEFDKTEPDWFVLDHLLTTLGDSINDLADDETLLTDAITSCWEHTSIERMTKLIEMLLSHGYDPKANQGRNGALGLHQLCWSSYNSGIISAAKMLIDAGADPKIAPIPDEVLEPDEGVLESIEWKLSGSWHGPDFDVANLFEAYHDLAESAINGEDYHCIHNHDICIGHKLISISSVKKLQPETSSETDDYLVLWFENNLPLVFDRTTACVVNPHIIKSEICESRDISTEITGILHATLREFRFIDACTVLLVFSDDKGLLITNNYGTSPKGENRTILYREVDHCADSYPEAGLKISNILLRKGDITKDTAETENYAFVLRSDDADYLIYTTCSLENDILHSTKLPAGYCYWLTVRPDFIGMVCTGTLSGKDNQVCAITLDCDPGNVCLSIGAHQNLYLRLTEQPVTAKDVLSGNINGRTVRYRGF